MKWSVGIEAEGDRVLTREQVVELADAVAASSGIATGIGTTRYGALAAERFPFQHPRAHCWIKRAGSKWTVHICTYEVPGGSRMHREQIARELTAIYRPQCNDQHYDQAWKDHWIGETTASAPGLAKDPARPAEPPKQARCVEPGESPVP